MATEDADAGAAELSETQRIKLKQAAEADAGGWPGLAADLRAEVERSLLATQKAAQTRLETRARFDRLADPNYVATAKDALDVERRRSARLAKLDAARLAASAPPPASVLQTKELKVLTASEVKAEEARQFDARADALNNQAREASEAGDRTSALALWRQVRELRGKARSAGREAGRMAKGVQRAQDARTDALWADQAIREIAAQASARGEDLLQGEGGVLQRPQEPTELERMTEDRGELTYRQMVAGNRYEAVLRRLMPALKTSTSSFESSGSGGVRASEAEVHALQERCAIWKALDHDARAIQVLDHVCFAGLSLTTLARGDRRQRRRWLKRLQEALDVVADHYALPRYQRSSAA